MRVMRRWLTILAVLFLALIQTVAAAQASMSECVESCPDDQDGRCPPTCACTCHAPRRPTPAEVVVFSAPPSGRERRCPCDDELPPSPEPGQIRHVPKSA